MDFLAPIDENDDMDFEDLILEQESLNLSQWKWNQVRIRRRKRVS